MNLCDYNTIRDLLARHGFHFSKSMGQNFLIDPEVPRRIAEASGADAGCGVLEIGPGIGPLTAELAQRAGKVVAVELDRALLPVLAETMAPYPNVEVVPGDVLKLDLTAIAAEKFQGLTPIVCANLPYVTSPILEKLVESPCFTAFTVMIHRKQHQQNQKQGNERQHPQGRHCDASCSGSSICICACSVSCDISEISGSSSKDCRPKVRRKSGVV